jgi:regulation of enolase protein 1 (concanavalin A-like superfamily)
MIHRYTSYDTNGYTFYTRAQDNKKTNQNSSVRTDAYNCDGNRETYYGFIEEIWELEYRETYFGSHCSVANESDSQME